MKALLIYNWNFLIPVLNLCFILSFLYRNKHKTTTKIEKYVLLLFIIVLVINVFVSSKSTQQLSSLFNVIGKTISGNNLSDSISILSIIIDILIAIYDNRVVQHVSFNSIELSQPQKSGNNTVIRLKLIQKHPEVQNSTLSVQIKSVSLYPIKLVNVFEDDKCLLKYINNPSIKGINYKSDEVRVLDYDGTKEESYVNIEIIDNNNLLADNLNDNAFNCEDRKKLLLVISYNVFNDRFLNKHIKQPLYKRIKHVENNDFVKLSLLENGTKSFVYNKNS